MEFAGNVPVLYCARSIGRTSLYVTRAVVLSPLLDTGWFSSYGTPIGHGYVPLLCWRSQVYIVLCACATGPVARVHSTRFSNGIPLEI